MTPVRIGAKRIDWPRPPEADFVTLDPEGNRFDVVQLR